MWWEKPSGQPNLSLRLTAAWVFVFLRALHGAACCTFDPVMLRFYLIATLAAWFMVVRTALAHFGGWVRLQEYRLRGVGSQSAADA